VTQVNNSVGAEELLEEALELAEKTQRVDILQDEL
jgi:hypothetical protein